MAIKSRVFVSWRRMVVRLPPLSIVFGINRFKTHGIILFLAKTNGTVVSFTDLFSDASRQGTRGSLAPL